MMLLKLHQLLANIWKHQKPFLTQYGLEKKDKARLLKISVGSSQEKAAVL